MVHRAEKHNCDGGRKRMGTVSPLQVDTHMEIKALEKGALKIHSLYPHPLERYLLNLRNEIGISV